MSEHPIESLMMTAMSSIQDMVDWIAGSLTRAQAQKALTSRTEIGNTLDGR